MRRSRWWLFGVLAACMLTPPALLAHAPNDTAMVEAGRDVYNQCIGCHSPDRNRTGPMHCGLVGRVSGTVDGFDYSDAMRNAGITWTARTLDRFLEAPLEMVPGTRMGFAGIKNDTERRQLIAWLETLTASSPICEDMPATQTTSRRP